MHYTARSIVISLVLSGILINPSRGQAVGTSRNRSRASSSVGIKGLPYSATRTTTSVKPLPDGTTFTQQGISREARDSQGRTMHEYGAWEHGNPTHVEVIDPVAGTWTYWSSNSSIRQAIVSGIPADPGFSKHDWSDLPKGSDAHQQRLGGKMIRNIYAEGVRVTGKPPYLRDGNQRVLITIDTWRSPELKIIVSQTSRIPRIGVTTEEITDFSRSEPDPSLFKVPAGFTVIDKRRNQLR